MVTPPTAQPLKVSDMGGGGESEFLQVEHVGERVEPGHKLVKTVRADIHTANIVCSDQTFVVQRWQYRMLGCLLCRGCGLAS